MFLQAQGKINLCQLDKPVETLREPSNQDLCNSRSHYKWHRQTWVQSEASSAGELLVWLASLEPCFQVRWWLFTCPERGEKRNLFHSCQHLVTLISFLTLDFDTWECYETRGVDQDYGKVLFKGSAWHRWHFLFFCLSFFILSLLRREMCHSLRRDFSDSALPTVKQCIVFG